MWHASVSPVVQVVSLRLLEDGTYVPDFLDEGAMKNQGEGFAKYSTGVYTVEQVIWGDCWEAAHFSTSLPFALRRPLAALVKIRTNRMFGWSYSGCCNWKISIYFDRLHTKWQ